MSGQQSVIKTSRVNIKFSPVHVTGGELQRIYDIHVIKVTTG